VSHEKIDDANQYFDLSTLEESTAFQGDEDSSMDADITTLGATTTNDNDSEISDPIVWLRYEPFILHVACRSQQAAGVLMAAARPSFKNVGLTTWKDGKYLVLILGDESLEMPITTLDGASLVETFTCEWLAELVNERHERNWRKIQGFVELARCMTLDDDLAYPVDEFMMIQQQEDVSEVANASPRSFDVI
jgi:tRNA(Phe) wybutosine-synthesizing methylase Tyw3